MSFIFIPNINAHEANIIDGKNNKSLKINECDGFYYGYHKYNDNYHFHQVEWNKENKQWDILEPEIIFPKNPCTEKTNKQYTVKFHSCVDGDTVKLILNKEIITTRLLAVDTPELNSQNESVKSLAMKARDFTCETLKNAKKITIEYDEKSDKFDKYNRHLIWLFTDKGLIQESLVRNSYAKVAYLYNRYKYTPLLQVQEEIAANHKQGVWKFTEEELSGKPKAEKELTEPEIIEKLIYIILVIAFSIIAIKQRVKQK